MSLLDGPHAVSVRPAVVSDGALGTQVSYGPPVVVEGVTIQPAAEAELARGGTSASYRLFGRRGWPGGALSRVTVLRGPLLGEFDQDGPAHVHAEGSAADHYRVMLTARGTADR